MSHTVTTLAELFQTISCGVGGMSENSCCKVLACFFSPPKSTTLHCLYALKARPKETYVCFLLSGCCVPDQELRGVNKDRIAGTATASSLLCLGLVSIQAHDIHRFCDFSYVVTWPVSSLGKVIWTFGWMLMCT